MASHPVICVAADGSAGSRRALEWALAEAALHHCGVELVSAYKPSDADDVDAARAGAEAAVHATMDGIIAGRADLPTVSWEVVRGDPAEVLTRASATAQLLVMGSHSTSGLVHSALGSVADMCARTAECPVVIIPPRGPASKPHDDLALVDANGTGGAP